MAAMRAPPLALAAPIALAALCLLAAGVAHGQAKPPRKPPPPPPVRVEPPPPPAPAPRRAPVTPYRGDPGPACRAQCAKDRYTCQGGDDAQECDGRWLTCMARCGR